MKVKAFFVISFLVIGSSLYSQEDIKIDILNTIKTTLYEIDFPEYYDHMSDEYIILKHNCDYGPAGAEIGLTNVIQICLANPNDKWVDIIINHFEQIRLVEIEKQKYSFWLDSYESAKEHLKYRLYPIDYQVYSKGTISRVEFDSMYGIVVIDYPSMVGNLERKYLDLWEIDENEIIEYAVYNTIKNISMEFKKFTLTDGFEFYGIESGSDIFIATIMLDLSKKKLPDATYGYIVSTPNRGIIIAVPLNKKESINAAAVKSMLISAQLYSYGPGSINDEIYWYYGGSVYLIQHDRTSRMIVFPKEFFEIVK